MNSRDRLVKAINHEYCDKVPVDIGATFVTGINSSTLYKLRKRLNLADKPIMVQDPGQMLGVIDEDIRKAIGIDVIGLWGPDNILGVRNEDWKPWNMPDGTPVLMPGRFEYNVIDGTVYAYPQGDRTSNPSMKMPASSYFFDSVDRSCDFDVNNLNPRSDFRDAFIIFDDNTARYLENESKNLYENTSYGVVGNFGGGGFGDVGQLPGQSIKNPKGIRRLDDWLVAHILYPDYILELFELQADIAIKNLKIYRDAVGDRIQVIYVSGTDFGTQKSELISPEIYRKLYKPFNKRINDWIHKNTSWKTFYHSCGSIINIMDDLIESGVDIVNPVQCSAEGMEPNLLKSKYGEKVVFWGGAVDTQAILPFGSKEEVANQVKERLEIFTKGSGYVFSTIHNIVGNIPIDNIISMLDAIKNDKA